MSNAAFLSDIRAFLAKTGMQPTYFGRCAASNSRLVERLEQGKRVWPETELKVRAWMLANAHRRPRASKLEAAE